MDEDRANRLLRAVEDLADEGLFSSAVLAIEDLSQREDLSPVHRSRLRTITEAMITRLLSRGQRSHAEDSALETLLSCDSLPVC